METPQCPKCSWTMEEGYLVDNSQGGKTPAVWVGGAPERSFWTGLKTIGKVKLVVATYRCTVCGYLESYAKLPQA